MASNLTIDGLTRQHLVLFGQLREIPEMHARFIAATGLMYHAPIVTRDPDIQVHPLIRTVW